MLVLNFTVYANHCPQDQVHTDLGCLSQNPASFTSNLYTIGLSLIGGVALLAIIYGAFLILSSQGDSQKLKLGKSYIFYAICGLVLAISGYALYQIITRDIFQIPGF